MNLINGYIIDDLIFISQRSMELFNLKYVNQVKCEFQLSLIYLRLLVSSSAKNSIQKLA
jgi:hypothetical protein